MLFPSSRHHPRQEPDAVIPLVRICAGGGPKRPVPTATINLNEQHAYCVAYRPTQEHMVRLEVRLHVTTLLPDAGQELVHIAGQSRGSSAVLAGYVEMETGPKPEILQSVIPYGFARRA